MDEEEVKKETENQESASADTGEGDKSEETPKLAKLRKDNERLEKQLEKKKSLIAEEEELRAREQLGGKAEAGAQPLKPKKLSDEEYAELVRKGEANPLKDDGFV